MDPSHPKIGPAPWSRHETALHRRDGTARLVGVAAALAAVACEGPNRPAPAADETPADRPLAEALLFPDGTGGLSAEDRSTIVATLDLRPSDDGLDLLDPTCGRVVNHAVSFPDLDGDGRNEVLVDFGNTCTSGMAGTSVILFVADDQGRYRPNLGFPGMIAEIRPREGARYPDLVIGGPGFCRGVWAWTGAEYEHARNEAQAPGGCHDRGGGDGGRRQ